MVAVNILEPRRYCYYTFSGYRCEPSRWDSWGRWVFLGVIIVAAILCFYVLACVNSRRRRSRGQQPIYGTGWMAPQPQQLPKYSQNPEPGHQRWNSQQPPPPPPPPPNGYYGPPPPGYSGQQDPNVPYQQSEGIQLQQPQQAYHGHTAENFAPPPGPPPGK
ncbi:hypothetical protein TD95_003483 [Thielaviopsis punctulata]|uniref:Chitin synthesis regulation, resistance to congo red-domain-containing protein n=1 Tax=Thielaviopsis punctulata TaxID=72032 RepID=A0A0F4ZEY0_9PEZI|nr:hypothetical protein TD95_003483 [Thielaviopsis punctulata]